MTESRASARPRQVTMAAGVTIGACALLIIELFALMGQLRSVEMRDTNQQILLTSFPGSGWTIADVVQVMRVLVLVCGALAATCGVLGVFVLQRHKRARVALTVAAALLACTAPFLLSAGVFAFLVVVGVAMLWTQPARDWFAGRSPQPAGTGSRRLESSSAPPPDASDEGRASGWAGGWWSSGSGSGPQPGGDQSGEPGQPGQPPAQPADRPFGQPPGPRSGEPSDQPASAQPVSPAASGYPFGQQTAPYSSRPDPSWAPPAYGQVPAGPIRRPATVTVAAALTWVVCGATLLLFGVVALLLIVAQDQLIESVRREVSVQSLNSSQLLATLWLASAIIMFWCLVAIVLAVLTVQGYSWARFTLVASAVVAAVFTVFTFPVGLLNTIASVAVIILLFTGGANAWFAQRGASRSQGGPPSGGPSSGGPLPPAPPPPPREKPPSNVW